VTRSPITWSRALRALVVACALVLVLTFVAANFVLVDLRLWGLDVETRLAWAAVVPAALGFGAGTLFCRTRGPARDHESPQASAVKSGSEARSGRRDVETR
jgi:H+/Cl- antiporter ClcA